MSVKAKYIAKKKLAHRKIFLVEKGKKETLLHDQPFDHYNAVITILQQCTLSARPNSCLERGSLTVSEVGTTTDGSKKNLPGQVGVIHY